jgi:hypothetical protein
VNSKAKRLTNFSIQIGGLKKDALIKNKNGRIVSKKMSARGKASKWIKAVTAARKALGIKGFAVCIVTRTFPLNKSETK